jgi:ribonucleoside-diphosphate reductase alpha chain
MDSTHIARTVLEKRYLRLKPDGTKETPNEMIDRVATTIASVDKAYGATDDEVERLGDAFYRMIDDQDFMPNSPTFTGAGTPLGQMSACFVLPVDDSLADIYETMKRAALIHQTGGGTGFAFSRLRHDGASVRSSGGVASGPVSFLKVYNASTEAIKQGGTRRGANMGMLRVDHPDILDFIHVKDDLSQVTNFNISVAITDEFMRAVEEKRSYDLVNPKDGAVVGQLDANDVWTQLIESAWKTGEPGVIFIDRVNRRHPNNHVETIEATNPCGEQPLPPYGSCTLGSINLARFVLNPYTPHAHVDWSRLAKITHLATHFLDNVLDANTYPIDELRQKAMADRRIGLGIMGWAEMLVQLGLAYDSDEGCAKARQVMSFLKQESVTESSRLALERGVYPEWYGSAWEAAGVKVRNATLTTIAPTGTISILAATPTMPVSGGCEPKFALAFTRNQAGETMIDVDGQFASIAKNEGWYSDALMERIAASGSCRGVEGVPERWQRVFVVANEISPEAHVAMQVAFQGEDDLDVIDAPIDSAVSKTVNFPNHATIDDVRTVYEMAWTHGLKGIAVYRDGSRFGQVLSVGTTTEAKKDDDATITVETIVKAITSGETPEGAYVHTITLDGPSFTKRPSRVYGFTDKIHVTIGEKTTKAYVTINIDENGQPFEVFVNANDATIADTAQALGRMATQMLRYGGTSDNVAQVVDHLRRGQSSMFSLPSQVAKMIDEVAYKGVKFPGKERVIQRPPVEGTIPLAEIERVVGEVRKSRLVECSECGQKAFDKASCVCRECGASKCS